MAGIIIFIINRVDNVYILNLAKAQWNSLKGAMSYLLSFFFTWF